MADKQVDFDLGMITPETAAEFETDRLVAIHNTLHEAAGEDGADCLSLRQAHDIVAVEILGRDMEHETPILCPDAELLTDAPNYRRSFNEQICVNCAFGQMPEWCNLYKFSYENGFLCDSWQSPQFLELERPHPFLISKGQQTAIASDESLPHGQPLIITSGDEAHGIVILEQPAQMQVKQFDREEWRDQHCIKGHERRLWWPDATALYVQQIKKWIPFDEPKLYTSGKITSYEPTETEKRILSKSRTKLPKEIVLIPEAVQVTGDRQFIQSGLGPEAVAQLGKVLKAAYEIDIEYAGDDADSVAPVYSLALVRKPALKFRKPTQGKEKGKGNDTNPETDDGDHEINMSATQYLYTNSKAAAELGRAMLAAVGRMVNDDRTRPDVVKMVASAMGIKPDTVNALLRGEHIPPDEGLEKFANAVGANFERLRAIAHKDSHLDDDEEEDDEGKKQEGFSDAPWDGAADRWDTADALCRDSLIDVNPAGEDKIKGLCKLPFRDPGTEKPNKNAVRAIGGARGITAITKPADVPQELWDRKERAAANKIIGWWPKAFEDRQASDAIFRLAGKEPPAEKAGRRLGMRWLKRLKDAVGAITDPLTALVELITWAEYSDSRDEQRSEALSGLPPGLFKGNSGFAVKAVDGKLWHFTWSTNAFKDRDREIFTTKALEDYVLEAEKRSERGLFDFWHIPGTDFARKEWQGVIGRFLVEAGPYLDNYQGQRAAKFFEKYPDSHPKIAPEGWGCSPEFKFLPEERETGVYDWLWIIRTTTLPRSAAANIWTQAKQEEVKTMALTKDQLEAGVEIWDEDFMESLVADGKKRTQDLEAARVAHKDQAPQTEEETTPPVAEEPPTETAKAAPEEPEKSNVTVDLDELAEAVSKQFNLDFEPLVAGITTLALEMKTLGERVEKIELSEAVKAQVETPRYTLNLARASQAEETVVKKDDDLMKQGPKGQLPKQGDIASAIFPAK